MSFEIFRVKLKTYLLVFKNCFKNKKKYFYYIHQFKIFFIMILIAIQTIVFCLSNFRNIFVVSLWFFRLMSFVIDEKLCEINKNIFLKNISTQNLFCDNVDCISYNWFLIIHITKNLSFFIMNFSFVIKLLFFANLSIDAQFCKFANEYTIAWIHWNFKIKIESKNSMNSILVINLYKWMHVNDVFYINHFVIAFDMILKNFYFK